MPRYRRRRRRRFSGRRRRIRRRTARRRYRRRGYTNKTYYYKRQQRQAIQRTVAAATATFASIAFSLDQMPNYTEFTQLYDQYKIRKVKVEWVNQRSVNTDSYTFSIVDPTTGIVTGGTSTRIFPEIWTVIDRDDTAPPTTLGEMLEYQSLRVTKGATRHKRILRPKFAVPVFRGALSADGYMPRSGWIDCSYPDVPHYGIKDAYVNPDNNDAAVFSGEQIITYYVAFRTVR